MMRFFNRLEEKSRDSSAAPVLVVALGDSVTQGFMEHGRVDPEAVYHHQLQRMLEARHPLATISTLNAGCGGESAPGGLARLQRDVLRHMPDLVIVGYALNDACSRERAGLDDFVETVSTIIVRVRNETDADVVVLTPNMLLTRDNTAVADIHRSLVPHFLHVQRDGILDAYAQDLRRLAVERGVRCADVYALWQDLAEMGQDTTALLCNGLNHPNGVMHRRAAERIFLTLNSHPSVAVSVAMAQQENSSCL